MKAEVRKAAKEYEQDFREIIRQFRETHDVDSEYKLRREMTFDEAEDIDFDLMDFYFDGMLSNILSRAKASIHMGEKWTQVYAKYRFDVARYVGWESRADKERHPMLRSREAYDLVTGRLEDVCFNEWYKQKGEAK